MAVNPNQPGGNPDELLQASDNVPFLEHEAHLLTTERMSAEEAARARESHVNWANMSRATVDMQRLGVRAEIQEAIGGFSVTASQILDRRVSMRMFDWVKNNTQLGFVSSRIGFLGERRQRQRFEEIFGTSLDNATLATMLGAMGAAPAGLPQEFMRVVTEEKMKMQMANLADPRVLHDYLGQLNDGAMPAAWGALAPIPAGGVAPAPVSPADFARSVRTRLRNILDYPEFERSVGFDSYSKALAIELARQMDNPGVLPGTQFEMLDQILKNLEDQLAREGAKNDRAKEIDAIGENMVSRIENLSELYAKSEQLNVDFVNNKRGLASVRTGRTGGSRTDTTAQQEAQWQKRIDESDGRREALYAQIKEAEKQFVTFADNSLDNLEIAAPAAGATTFLQDLRVRINANAMVTSAKRTLFPTFEPVPAAAAPGGPAVPPLNASTGTYFKAYIESVYPGGLEGAVPIGGGFVAPTTGQISALRGEISTLKSNSSSIPPARVLYHLKYAMHSPFPGNVANPNVIIDTNERERVALMEVKMLEMDVQTQELHQSKNEKIAKVLAQRDFGRFEAFDHWVSDTLKKGTMEAQAAIVRAAHDIGEPTLAGLTPNSTRQKMREILGSSQNTVTPKKLEDFIVVLDRLFKGFEADGKYVGAKFLKENAYLGEMIYMLHRLKTELATGRVLHAVNAQNPDASERETMISRLFVQQRTMSGEESWKYFDEKFRNMFGVEGEKAMDEALTKAKKDFREIPLFGEYSVLIPWPWRKRGKRKGEIVTENMELSQIKGAYEAQPWFKRWWYSQAHWVKHFIRDPLDEEHTVVRAGNKVKGWYSWTKDKLSKLKK